MSIRKLRINGYYGQKIDKPFKFIPAGIYLNLLLHRENGFKIEHAIGVDSKKVAQHIHYDKPAHGCGSLAIMRELI